MFANSSTNSFRKLSTHKAAIGFNYDTGTTADHVGTQSKLSEQDTVNDDLSDSDYDPEFGTRQLYYSATLIHYSERCRQRIFYNFSFFENLDRQLV